MSPRRGREEIAARLAAAVRRRWADGETRALRRLSGGASRETWSFDLRVAGTDLPSILRRDRSPSPMAMSLTLEHALVEHLGTTAVPVPAVRFALVPDDDLGNGYAMERIEGETIPRKILRDAPFRDVLPALAGQCGRILATVHHVDPAGLPSLTHQGAEVQLDRLRALLDGFGEPHPAFELALRWLTDRVPVPVGPALVHGDFRNGNLLVDPDGVQAVLDWELAHLGDPMEDLGWLCVRAWRFGSPLPVGGFGSREDLFAGYEAVTGRCVDPIRVQFWEVLGTLKWGVLCQVQTFTHLNGLHRSVELAALGRRVCETEWDLLSYLETGDR